MTKLLRVFVLAVASLAAAYALTGCVGPRAVFLPSMDSPVRAGPNVSGKVYIWTGNGWELSGNNVAIPEGLYIWDSGEGRRNLKGTATNSVFYK